MTRSPTGTSPYLRIEELRSLRHLAFTTRRPVSGLYAGRHASPQRGHSVEFTDYREYTPGDELGDIDWKVYGRSDRWVVKRYEHQSDMGVCLLIDGSASMAYRGRPPSAARRGLVLAQRLTREPAAAAPPSKYDQACRLAAAIAFLAIRQQDQVSLGIARRGLADYRPPHSSHPHLRGLLAAMEAGAPRRPAAADLARALGDLAARTSRKGLVVVFSDLMEDLDGVLEALARFTHRGNEVIVFHVLHPDELRLPDLEDTILVDSETGEELRVDPAAVRKLYEARLHRFVEAWRAAFRTRGIDFNRVRTDEPFQQALRGYLCLRAARLR